MSKNQLFRKLPPRDFVIKILKIYGIDGFDVLKTFTLQSIQDNNVITNLQSYDSELKKYYMKCKWKYITNLTPKKCVTLLRQLLKLYDYRVLSKEKCVKGNKFCQYSIIEHIEEIELTEELKNKLKVSFQ